MINRLATELKSPALPLHAILHDAETASNRELYALHTQALVHKRNPATPSSAIIDWCQRSHDCLARFARRNSDEVKRWQDLLLPFFLEGEFLKRCHEQPRGYAGDYLTIQMIYDDAPRSAHDFGRAVDIWAMAQPCPRAVRNRRFLVGNFVQQVRENFSPPSIVSLGCGPATEVFDTRRRDGVDFTLIDIDAEAISHVLEKARSCSDAQHIKTINANIIKMILRDDGTLPGSHSAFYSMGLIDYFRDDLVVRLLDYIYSKLEPGGMVMLGNFRPDHPNVALFQHALNWPLLLRSEGDLLRLAAESRFANSSVHVGAEAEGVQLFMHCVKTDR
jgi:extracellular factor (EF) 3-hydroxypalmitic acid methyl ester biosynthesis protein